MQGYKLIFMAPGGRRHEGKPVLDAIIHLAQDLGIKHYTKRVDTQSRGSSEHIHSAHFFELADQPQELMFIVDRDKGDKLLKVVADENMNVYCVQSEVQYHQFGSA